MSIPAAMLQCVARAVLTGPPSLDELAERVWTAWSSAVEAPARGEEIRALAKAAEGEYRQAVNEVVHTVAANHGDAVRLTLTTYLVGIPAAIRQAARRAAAGAGTAKAKFSLASAADLIPLLPVNLPRLTVGTVADGPGVTDEDATVTLTVTAGPHQGRVFTLTGHDTFLVGRSRYAHLALPDKDRYFSRAHFFLESNPPRCRILDLGSRNGTYVNDQLISGPTELRDGDRIKAGHTLLEVSIPAAQDDLVPLELTAPYLPELSEPSSPQPAGTVAGYDLVRELGRGGMGVVYLATRRADGARVALKTLTPLHTGNPRDVQRFLREARILCALDHPYIVAFQEMGEAEDGRLYFAMEYVAGTDAGRLLKENGPLPIAKAVDLVCQLLQALEYAHAKGFVHRDIKPANLLLDGATVKLADFGLARVFQASKLSGLTMTGEVGGTALFMPPEQVTNYRECRPPVDQYAAAATLYNLLTGKYVYDPAPTTHQRLKQILDDDPVPIQSRRGDVPDAVAAVLHRALERDPARRFADVKALRKALRPFASREGPR